MRRWIGMAAQLYPPGWRARYGDEFAALLEDMNPGWREFADVLGGALTMQMTNTAVWKLAGGMAVAGAIAALAISLSAPRVYESTAVLRLTPNSKEAGAQTPELQAQQLSRMEQEILSRTSLEGIITNPSLDLYKKQRREMPMEDIVADMRTRYIRIRMRADGTAFAISFAYPDQYKAQGVVRELVGKFTEQNVAQARWQARFWHEIWPQSAPPPAMNMEVLDPPSNPDQPINASPIPWAAAGLGAGLLLGLLIAVAIQRPKWTLQMAGFAVGCGVLALAPSYILLPDRYTSTCVMQLTPQMVPTDPNAAPAVSHVADELPDLRRKVLSDASLQSIITDPALDLYAEQRRKEPMQKVIETMRRDLTVDRAGPSREAFRIAFTYPDKFKAQAVVRSVVTKFVEENVAQARQRVRALNNPKQMEIEERRMGENLEVLDPPSDPQAPVSPNRLRILLVSLAAGLVLGAATLHFRKGGRQALQPA